MPVAAIESDQSGEGRVVRVTLGEPMNEEGDYTVRVGPLIQDRMVFSKNLMDQDEDGFQGTPNDEMVVKFHMLPSSVVVSGSAEWRGSYFADPRPLADASIALIEVVGGSSDASPGQGDDYVISQTNDANNSKFTLTDNSTFLSGTFQYTHDSQGKVITKTDPREDNSPRQIYVVAYAQNPYVSFVQGGSFTNQNHDADVGWVRVHPEPLPEGVVQQWARLVELGRSQVVTIDPNAAGSADASFVVQIEDGTVQVLSWLRAAAAHLEEQRLPGRAPLVVTWDRAMAHREHAFDFDNDVLLLRKGLTNDPLALWHAYAHALQFAYNGYHKIDVLQDDAGVIMASGSEKTAFAEGFGSWFAAWMWREATTGAISASWSFPRVHGSDSSQPSSRWRLPWYLAHNDYWMGADGYGLPGNLAASDDQINPDALVCDGVNDDANTSTTIAGAIASIMMQLPAADVLATVKQSADQSTLADFYSAFPYHGSHVDAVFIDNGYPAAGPQANNTPDKARSLGELDSPYSLPGLVMNEETKGTGNWFTFTVPQTETDPEKAIAYSLYVSLAFKALYGDLDLIVYREHGGNRIEIGRDTLRGGDRALVPVRDLRNTESYSFVVGVFGHGATDADKGGDMNPDYTLAVTVNVPGPKKKEEEKDKKQTQNKYAPDPNEMVGPAGFGALNYIPPSQLLPYNIRFENLPAATAPAQEVHVTAQLDSDLDWSTFAFDEIAFGDHIVSVPDGMQYFTTDVDLRSEGNPVIVRITANLDALGLLTADFTALDPVTGQLVEDPIAGFLPPNDASHRGEGWISYTIRSKTGLSTATEIRDKAVIVFDVNAPIETNEVLSTIDAGPPSSQVQPLPATVFSESFVVNWSGVDDTGGSGIASYDIYVSMNGQPFTQWLANTPQTSATFLGAADSHYRFYSIATDNVGYLETSPDSGFDTQTVVSTRPWHNELRPLDISNDGFVVPMDVLLIINELNNSKYHDATGRLQIPPPAEMPPPYYDPNNDGFVTPLDALVIINYLNSPGAALDEDNNPGTPGEGESRLIAQAMFGNLMMVFDELDEVMVPRANGREAGAERMLIRAMGPSAAMNQRSSERQQTQMRCRSTMADAEEQLEIMLEEIACDVAKAFGDRSQSNRETRRRL